MKKFYTIAAVAAVIAGTATAQDKPQFPNADFEAWKDCIPWTSTGNTKVKGTTPEYWCVSNVAGVGGLGATEIAKAVAGANETDKAVKVFNTTTVGKAVPGYFTLGTTWSTAVGTKGKNADGGTFGGVEFTGRPESITFMYKRSHGTANPNEQATVVAYLWKGTFKQANVPGTIVLSGTPKAVTMVDRDRNILGMETLQGGEVTEKGTLVAKINYAITGDAAEWTELTIPFEYVSEETPEKANVIFCAGDYFSTTPGKDNTLEIDNVRLNYAEAPATVVSTKKYVGLLVVRLGSDEPSQMENQDVYMDELSNGMYRLRLENFGATTDDPVGMGSIIVDVKSDNGNLTGHNDNISLAGGIEATADVTGTMTSTDLDLHIDVIWKEQPDVPITVTFNGKAESDAITSVEADANAAVEYYNLNGVRVNGDNLSAGVYVRRQGNKVSKVLVK